MFNIASVLLCIPSHVVHEILVHMVVLKTNDAGIINAVAVHAQYGVAYKK